MEPLLALQMVVWTASWCLIVQWRGAGGKMLIGIPTVTWLQEVGDLVFKYNLKSYLQDIVAYINFEEESSGIIYLLYFI